MLLAHASSLSSNSLPIPAIRDHGRQSRHLFKFLTPSKIVFLALVHIYCVAAIKPRYNTVFFTFLLRQIEVPNDQRLRSDKRIASHRIPYYPLAGDFAGFDTL